ITTPSLSQVRQNFPAECEAGVTCMVNLELYASGVFVYAEKGSMQRSS
uniref:Uncharacterized protein n=1 Tax=Terrapene triunguis TaxID=2587831 RepID=A0A674I572_9SAUR